MPITRAITGPAPSAATPMPPSGSNRQRRKLLPVPYYLVTFTVPAQLRQVIRSHQKDLYPLLVAPSAARLAGRGPRPQRPRRPTRLAGRAPDLDPRPALPSRTSIASCPPAGSPPTACAGSVPKREGYFLPQAALAMRFRTRLKQALQHEHPNLCAPNPSPPPGLWTGSPTSSPSAPANPPSNTWPLTSIAPPSVPSASSPTTARPSPSPAGTAQTAAPAPSDCPPNGSSTASSSTCCPGACSASATSAS